MLLNQKNVFLKNLGHFTGESLKGTFQRKNKPKKEKKSRPDETSEDGLQGHVLNWGKEMELSNRSDCSFFKTLLGGWVCSLWSICCLRSTIFSETIKICLFNDWEIPGALKLVAQPALFNQVNCCPPHGTTCAYHSEARVHVIQKPKPLYFVTQTFAALLLPDEASQLVFLQHESKGAAGRYSLWQVIGFEARFTAWVCHQPCPFTFQDCYKACVCLTADMGFSICAIAQIAQIANASSI